MAGRAWRARMEERDLKVHGKENWRVHAEGRNRRVHERGCSVRVGKDLMEGPWKGGGEGWSAGGEPVEDMGKGGLESPRARWTVVVREGVRT